jgi:hypothetical protein
MAWEQVTLQFTAQAPTTTFIIASMELGAAGPVIDDVSVMESTAHLKRIDAWAIFSMEPGDNGTTRLEVGGGGIDNGLTVEAAVYYVRGDFATISAIVDKARGANPAWYVDAAH